MHLSSLRFLTAIHCIAATLLLAACTTQPAVPLAILAAQDSDVVQITPYPSSMPSATTANGGRPGSGSVIFAAPSFGGPASPEQSDARIFYALGWDKLVKQDYAGAIVEFDRWIALDPNVAMAYRVRGYAKHQQKAFKEALADFDRAIALNPNAADSYGCRGETKIALKDYDGAIADYNRVLSLQPKSALGYFSRGLAKRLKRDFPAALADFDRCLKLTPDFGPARRVRGDARYLAGNFSGALNDYEKMIALMPATPETDYARFFRNLLLSRLDRAGEDDLAKNVPGWKDGWPKTIGLFLTGQITGDEFTQRASAAPDEKTRREQTCEERYYAGMIDLLAGYTAAARVKFTACLATEMNNFTEFSLAQDELARLDAGTPTPKPATQ